MRKILKKHIEKVKIQLSGYTDTCMVACVALMFDCDTKDIPWGLLKASDENYWQEFVKWSNARGYHPICVGKDYKNKAQLLRGLKRDFPFYYILSGASKADKKEKARHAVLYKGDELIYDPRYMKVGEENFTKKFIKDHEIIYDLDVYLFVPLIPEPLGEE